MVKVWKDGASGGTPITAAELNRIEGAIDGAATKAASAESGLANKADKAALTDYALKSYVTTEINNAKLAGEGGAPDMSVYATDDEVQLWLADKADKTTLADYATKAEVPAAPDLTPYVKKSDADNTTTGYVPRSMTSNFVEAGKIPVRKAGGYLSSANGYAVGQQYNVVTNGMLEDMLAEAVKLAENGPLKALFDARVNALVEAKLVEKGVGSP